MDILLDDRELEELIGIEFNNTYSGHIAEYRAIVKSQAKKFTKWLMQYEDINLEEETGDKTTVFFIPNSELKRVRKEVEK